MTSPGRRRCHRRTAGRRSVPAALAPGLQLEGQWRPLPYRLRLPLLLHRCLYDWPGWGGATYTVTAANSGTVTVFPLPGASHRPNGWATNYHMSGIRCAAATTWPPTPPSAPMPATATRRCARAAPPPARTCTLPALQRVFQSLQGQKLSSYAVNVGASNYDDNCNRFWLYNQRNGQRYCAWQPLYNNGID